MSDETVQIVLVGGPYDGETHAIPEAEARSGCARRYAAPYNPGSLLVMYTADAPPVPVMPKSLEYRPMTVDFAGWPMPSITDDGIRRYKYAGER
jgi:hypothetical protein